MQELPDHVLRIHENNGWYKRRTRTSHSLLQTNLSNLKHGNMRSNLEKSVSNLLLEHSFNFLNCRFDIEIKYKKLPDIF